MQNEHSLGAALTIPSGAFSNTLLVELINTMESIRTNLANYDGCDAFDEALCAVRSCLEWRGVHLVQLEINLAPQFEIIPVN